MVARTKTKMPDSSQQSRRGKTPIKREREKKEEGAKKTTTAKQTF